MFMISEAVPRAAGEEWPVKVLSAHTPTGIGIERAPIPKGASLRVVKRASYFVRMCSKRKKS